MNTMKKRWLASAILGALAVSAIPSTVMAQTSSGTTATTAAPKVALSDSSGIVRSGQSFKLKATPTAAVTNVEWNLYLLDASGQATRQGKLMLPIGTAVEVSDKIQVWGKRYKVIPQYYKGDVFVTVGDAIELTALESVTITKAQVSKAVVSPKTSTTVLAQVELGALTEEPAAVNFNLNAGSKSGGTISVGARRVSKGVYEASLPVPGKSGVYPISVSVTQAFSQVTEIAAPASVSVVEPPKVVVANKPKLLDATDSAKPGSVTLRVINSVPESVLKSYVTDGKTQKSTFYAEWTKNGKPAVQTAADDPFSVTVTPAEYASLLAAAQAKAAGSSSSSSTPSGKAVTPVVTLPLSVKVYHPDYRAETETTLDIEVPVGAPWVMPNWSLAPNSTDKVIAPATVSLKATAGSAYDTAAAKLHKLKWIWSIPETGGVSGKGAGTTLRLSVNEPGQYPVKVIATDDLNHSVSATYIITAEAPTLSVTDVQTSLNPTSARYPVVVKPKVATASTHKQERVTGYTVKLDGQTLYTGNAVKPFTVNTAGTHNVTVVATSNMGSTAEKTVPITVLPNQKPTCNPLKTAFQKNKLGVVTGVSLTADCKDPDGRVKSYAWTLNDVASPVAAPRAGYTFNACENQVVATVVVTDDSGESTTHAETIQRGGVSDCQTAAAQ